MTVTPKSVGLSAGVKGARISANSSGRVTRTLGIPGSGISHTKTLSSGASSRSSAGARPATPSSPATPKPPTPGMFAPKWEKELHKAVLGKPDYSSLARIGSEYPPARHIAALLEATLVSVPAGDTARGLELISWLFADGYDPARDDFVRKYLPSAAFTLSIAEGISVQLAPDRDFIGLLLGELHQEAGNLPTAIDTIEQLEPSTVSAVSLAELYIAQERWADVVDLTEGLINEDEASTFLLIQRGIAFREQGYPDAARESFKEALRVRSRPAELRHRALIERGLTYLKEGKRAMARKDFEKVLAENSAYPGLREHLANFED
ncbi:DUF4236 domain-containing protein [Pseudarthrobacter oxydans]|uniref:DUF4236 domain-containing protein n=1 Tax=Pseudarthrobacter oxydans TaxID=1671 RepID=UPI0038064E97